jgi:pimeloyl-ACP methyl ester carboxylesterase
VGKLVLSNAAGIRVKGSPMTNIFAMNPQETLECLFVDQMAAMPIMPTSIDIDYFITQYRERMTLASLAWNPNYDPKLERRLERITAPTLIIWGALDKLIPPVYGETFNKGIKGSQLVSLQGTGHMPMFEKNAEWNKAISDFLEGK